MIKQIIFSLLTLFIFNIKAQDFDNYQPLKCSGDIPSDFTDRVINKAKEDIKANIDKTDSYGDKKKKSSFLLKSNYILDELLMSGRVLFGDPVSEYVNNVADKLLENEPELRQKLRFYCLKSNVTNAFSTNQGMIFVTLGLIAQLENEAQLAQVLAHEITHYTKKHVINSFIESSRISNHKGKYKYSNYDNDIITLSNYSKTLEFEADSIGYFRLKKAGYSIQEALSVFDILQFSYLPFDEKAFEFSHFETNNVKIPKSYKLDTIVDIKFIDDYDDSKSTHPNVRKRREKITALIQNEKGGKVFIQNKDLFNKIRTICRFEGVRLNNKNAAYVKATYNAQILLKNYPNSKFLKKSIAKSLYGLYKYKSKNKYYKVLIEYKETEGEISAAYYFFDKLSSEQIGSIALAKLNEYYLNNNKDQYILKLINNLVYELVSNDIDYNNYYKLKRISDSSKTIAEIKKENKIEEPQGKYAKLRAIQNKQEKEKRVVDSEDDLDKLFHHEYLIECKNSTEIESWFASANEKVDIDKVDPYEKMSRKQKRKEEKRKKKNLYANANISTNKIVFVDPDYFVIDERKGQKLENAEKKKYNFYKQVEMVAQKADIDYEILSPKVFEISDVEKYNDLAIINDWVSEKMNHSEVEENWSFIESETEYLAILIEKYNTSIFVYTGIIQYKYKNIDTGLMLLGTILAFPMIPYGIYYALPKYETYYYTLLYDIDNTSLKLENVEFLKIKTNQANINSLMYEMLIQIK